MAVRHIFIVLETNKYMVQKYIYIYIHTHTHTHCKNVYVLYKQYIYTLQDCISTRGKVTHYIG